MTIEQEIHTQAEAAKAASYPLAALPPGIRNDALCAMAQALTDCRAVILQANAVDMEEAAAAGMKSSYLDRLHLDDARIVGVWGLVLVGWCCAWGAGSGWRFAACVFRSV